ncbi:hypothetical protein BB559_004491 [Furculomyces boomerangus]|uniref:Uncharacterized protein n=1 Tax=Furculomyces boomerangus TaxID=61424 RepID=A0A2T9YEF5_9FUNG|nr:hypothetical protein BB559_004491 [Furculomyces boomerangus]
MSSEIEETRISIPTEEPRGRCDNIIYDRILSFRYSIRSYLAEFFGTLIFVFFGTGSVAAVTFQPDLRPVGWLLISFGFGFGIAMGIYVSIGISGGHVNPAVTIASAIFRKFPIFHVPFYILSQLLGGICGAALTYFIYMQKFTPYDGGTRKTTGTKSTAGIFATYPDSENTNIVSFFTEVILTTVFLFCIQGFVNTKIPQTTSYTPLAVGLLILVISISFGTMTGFSLNPARDLGPRLFTLMAGWGTNPFTAFSYYFWIPVVGPILGAILGIFLYDCFIIPT